MSKVEAEKSRLGKFLASLSGELLETELSFFAIITTSGIKEGVPFVELINGDILFGRRNQLSDRFERVFLKYRKEFESIGLKEECFGAAYDALNFYQNENCNSIIKKTDLIKRGDIVFDIGSRSGHFPVKGSRAVGESGRIYCIDATNHGESLLSMHIKYNRLCNVHFIKEAIGDVDGDRVKFFVGSDNETYSGLLEETVDYKNQQCARKEMHQSAIIVETKTMDTIVKEHGVEHIDCMLLQINGSELLALKGSDMILRRYKPTIYATAFQRIPGAVGGPKDEIYIFLKEYGYECILDTDEEVIYSVAGGKCL